MFDPFEDMLHSITATGMGFAVAFGVIARFFQRAPGNGLRKAYDAVAIVAASALPLMGKVWGPIGGPITTRLIPYRMLMVRM